MKSKLKMLVLFLKRYKTRSIFMRDFLTVFIITLIPVTAIGMFFYSNTKEMTNKEIINVNEANLKSCAGVMDSMLEEINGVVANMILNNDVKLYIISERDTAATLGVESKVHEYITDILVTREYIDSIYIYNDTYDLVFYQSVNTRIEEFADKGWYDSYINNNDIYSAEWSLRLKNDKYPQLISIVRPVYKDGYSVKAGAVICNINVEKLCEIIKTNSDILNEFIIADNENNVIYSKNRSLLGKKINVQPFKISSNITTGAESREEDIYVSAMKPEKFDGWQYMLKFQTSEYTQRISEMLYMSRMLILICVIISLVIAAFMTLKSFDFVSKLIDVIGRFDGNNSKDSFNETDYILSNIVSAMSMNEQLQNELLEQFNEMRNMQTIALQAQISPHFMRNTLSSINFKAFELFNGENEISDMLEAFSKLMDCYVRAGNYIVPVKTELENVELYAKLMNLRYGDKLNISYNIAPGLLDYSIIKITLQPIVENSIMHGFKQRRSRGNICITADLEKDNMILYVNDDGVGMSESDIAELNANLSDMQIGSGVGIHNVNKRYKIALGEEYGITVSKSDMGGLCVKITMPIMKPDEKSK